VGRGLKPLPKYDSAALQAEKRPAEERVGEKEEVNECRLREVEDDVGCGGESSRRMMAGNQGGEGRWKGGKVSLRATF